MILNPSYAVLKDSVKVPAYRGCLNETTYDEGTLLVTRTYV